MEIVVDAALPDVQKVLADNVGPKGLKKLSNLFGINQKVKCESELQRLASESQSRKEFAFEGEVGDRTFKIERAINYRNSFLPIIQGSFEQLSFGTKITIEMKISPFVIGIFLFILLLVFSGFGEVPSYIERIYLIAAIIVMAYSAFWFEVWRAKTKFLDIFKSMRKIGS